MTQRKVFSIRYKEGMDVNEPWRFIGRAFETREQAEAYMMTYYKRINSIYAVSVYEMELTAKGGSIEVSTFGELAIIENLLDDWLSAHGRTETLYDAARSLYERVQPALREAVKNM